MAQQRRCQRRGHHGRRGRGLGGVVLALAFSLSACAAPDQLGPSAGGGDQLGQPVPPPATGGGGSGGATLAALIGDFRVISVIPLNGDFQSTTTTWRFAADSTCRRTVSTTLLSEGIARVTIADCTYTTDVNSVIVTFPGSAPAVFSVSFAAFSPNRLVLDGVEYQRID